MILCRISAQVGVEPIICSTSVNLNLALVNLKLVSGCNIFDQSAQIPLYWLNKPTIFHAPFLFVGGVIFLMSLTF